MKPENTLWKNMPANWPISRTEFAERQEQCARAGNSLAALCVVIPLGAILCGTAINHWMDAWNGPAGLCRGGVCLGMFAVLFGAQFYLLFRYQRTRGDYGLTCPQCSGNLDGNAAHMVENTGCCCHCGSRLLTGDHRPLDDDTFRLTPFDEVAA